MFWSRCYCLRWPVSPGNWNAIIRRVSVKPRLRFSSFFVFSPRSTVIDFISEYSRLSLSRPRLSRITAYLEVKIWSLAQHEQFLLFSTMLLFQFSQWPSEYQRKVSYHIYNVSFPDDGWRNMKKPCTTERLFFPVSCLFLWDWIHFSEFYRCVNVGESLRKRIKPKGLC